MGEDHVHVVFGTGQVGNALSAHLFSLGLPVRAVSRHRPSTLVEGVDWRAADVTDPEAAIDAAKGASVIYQCLNAPYTEWPKRFPPLQRGVLSAAERNEALLVTLENLYAYGPTHSTPMTEDLPLAATTVKGRARAVDDPRTALRRRSRSGSDRHRARHRISSAQESPRRRWGSGSSPMLCPVDEPTFSATPTCPTPTAMFPTSRSAWPPSAPMRGQSARCGTCPDPRPLPPEHSSISLPPRVGHPVAIRSVPNWSCGPSACSTRPCGSWWR